MPIHESDHAAVWVVPAVTCPAARSASSSYRSPGSFTRRRSARTFALGASGDFGAETGAGATLARIIASVLGQWRGRVRSPALVRPPVPADGPIGPAA